MLKAISYVSNKKNLYIGSLIVILVFLVVISVKGLIFQSASAKNAADYKKAASQYLESGEKAGNPVNIKYQKIFYYFVPIEIKGELGFDLPGIMLNNKAEPVTDELILKELYKYPALVKEFTPTFKKFDSLAKNKAVLVKKYCNIISRERIKLGEIVFSGNVVGVIYQGTKLAFDAVSLVQNVPSGLAALVKDLAKGKVQDAIVSYFLPTDSREVLDSAQQAYDAADKAFKACNGLTDAWSVMHSTSGKVETLKAALAVQNLFSMFTYEAEAIANLGAALEKVNNYPELVTKINKKDFTTGMAAIKKLIEKLEAERDYWQERNASVVANAEMWRDEQLRRVQPEPIAQELEAQEPVVETPVSPSPLPQVPSSLHQVLNLSDNYSLYTYSTQSYSCGSYQNNISPSQVSLKCKSSSGHWRAHWVKKINVSGYNKLRIKADLTLNDYTHFFTECGGRGVKYDNYVDLIVLSSDPNAALSAECNRVVSDAEWPKCAIGNTHSSAITHCGVPKCGTNQSCDFEVDVSGKEAVYLLFYSTDPWLADIEGVLSNAEITLIK